MSQMSIIKIHEQYVAFSWTSSPIATKHERKICNDNDAIAYAMYLSRHGQPDLAEIFLADYCLWHKKLPLGVAFPMYKLGCSKC